MGKAKPNVGQKFPSILSTVVNVKPFLLDTATLWTFTEGSAGSDYGVKPKTWTSTDINCKRGYYKKAEEDPLPIALQEEELYIFMAEPSVLQERGFIYFKTVYYEILTVQQTIIEDTIIYDRGVARRCLHIPQGLS